MALLGVKLAELGPLEYPMPDFDSRLKVGACGVVTGDLLAMGVLSAKLAAGTWWVEKGPDWKVGEVLMEYGKLYGKVKHQAMPGKLLRKISAIGTT